MSTNSYLEDKLKTDKKTNNDNKDQPIQKSQQNDEELLGLLRDEDLLPDQL